MTTELHNYCRNILICVTGIIGALNCNCALILSRILPVVNSHQSTLSLDNYVKWLKKYKDKVKNCTNPHLKNNRKIKK